MENQNNGQNKRDNNEGFMEKVSDTIENFVENMSGDNDNRGKQQGQNNKR